MAVGTLQEVKITKNMQRFTLEVLPDDVRRTIQYVFQSELEAQAGLGARPTTVLIDGGKGQLNNVRKSAKAFFSNQDRVIAAVNEAWDKLISLTPIKSGAARASFALYKGGQYLGGRNAVDAAAKTLLPGEFLSVVGPGVPYGRYLYWNPLGKSRKRKVLIAKGRDSKGNNIRVSSMQTLGIHQIVKGSLRAKYRDLYITDEWTDLKHGSGMQGERWPAISVAFKSSRNSVV